MDLHRKVAVDTMRAVVQDRYGNADVLGLDDVARPVPGPGEVLVEVHAAGVDRGALHLMTGLPLLVRPVFGIRAPRERTRGREFAGRVVAVGPGVVDRAPGEEVFGVGEGCFAEFARARADRIAPAPARLTPIQAAALPISGLTALQAVRDYGRTGPGQSVLVLGAAGGVGTFAVQIAAAAGAHVTAACRPAKADLVRSLGAAHVLDQSRMELGDRFDVVIDCGGQRTLRVLRRALAPRGRLVIVGGETDGRWLGGLDRPLRAALWSPFLRQSLGSFVASENAADLRTLAAMADGGTLTPAVGHTVPLAETARALDDLAAGRARGKIVVDVAGTP